MFFGQDMLGMFLNFGAGMAGDANVVSGAALVNLGDSRSADLSIQVLCQTAKAWWPLASTVVGSCWCCVYMLHTTGTSGETYQEYYNYKYFNTFKTC